MKKLLLIYAVTVLYSCNFGDEVKDLNGGWKFVSESKHDKAIDGGDIHIPCEVTQYGYNSSFIIATQKPTEDCFLGKDTAIYKEGRDKIYYWLIVQKQKIVLGPMNETEFKQAKEKYKVPDNLELKPVD